ncbi:hypothetical protein BB559_002837 [Furculomyces boomerangus]|uniref:Endonuclease/exonuclease/phosphatase domain-containing protein n=1 Tax=Furculomyces boomerangus TaxID=61424 RepID=A0A2T9YRV8_9FUNG|nr:hypothetical protein BB559_002837 [Furculomyces boomerangus]
MPDENGTTFSYSGAVRKKSYKRISIKNLIYSDSNNGAPTMITSYGGDNILGLGMDPFKEDFEDVLDIVTSQINNDVASFSVNSRTKKLFVYFYNKEEQSKFVNKKIEFKGNQIQFSNTIKLKDDIVSITIPSFHGKSFNKLTYSLQLLQSHRSLNSACPALKIKEAKKVEKQQARNNNSISTTSGTFFTTLSKEVSNSFRLQNSNKRKKPYAKPHKTENYLNPISLTKSNSNNCFKALTVQDDTFRGTSDTFVESLQSLIVPRKLTFNIINVYALAHRTLKTSFYTNLLSIIPKTYNMVVLGDFNLVRDNSIDRFLASKKSNKWHKLDGLLEKLNLVDLHTYINKGIKIFTIFSHSGQWSGEIDHILVSRST